MAKFRKPDTSDPVAIVERVGKRSGRSWSWGLLAIPLVALGLGAAFLSPEWPDGAVIAAGPQVGNSTPAGRLTGDGEEVVHSAGWHPAIEIGIGPVGPLPGDGLGRHSAERAVR